MQVARLVLLRGAKPMFFVGMGGESMVALPAMCAGHVSSDHPEAGALVFPPISTGSA